MIFDYECPFLLSLIYVYTVHSPVVTAVAVKVQNFLEGWFSIISSASPQTVFIPSCENHQNTLDDPLLFACDGYLSTIRFYTDIYFLL